MWRPNTQQEGGQACTWSLCLGRVLAWCVAAVDVGRPPTAWLVLDNVSTSARRHLRRRHGTVSHHEAISRAIQSLFSTSDQSTRQMKLCLEVHE